MIPGVSDLVDTLKEFSGKSFFWAGMFPVLCVACLSFVIADQIFPDFRVFLETFSASDSALTQILKWIALLVAAALVSFIFWGLNPFFRESLECRWLPEGVRRFLESRQQRRRDRLGRLVDELQSEVGQFRAVAGMDFFEAKQEPLTDEKQRQWVLLLEQAGSEAGKKLGPRTPVGEEIEKKQEDLRTRRRKRERIPFREVEALFRALRERLASGPAEASLQAAHGEFEKLLRYAVSRAESEYREAFSRKFFSFPEESAALGPTAVANMAELSNHYAERRYGMQIDLFWPRLLKFILADDKFAPIFSESKNQLDFAVGMTWASIFFTLAWTPLTGLNATETWLVFAVAVGGFLSTALFYMVTLRAYRGFGELSRTALDFYRFDLLKALHMDPPADSEAEKQIWRLLRDHTEFGFGERPISYSGFKATPAPPKKEETEDGPTTSELPVELL